MVDAGAGAGVLTVGSISGADGHYARKVYVNLIVAEEVWVVMSAEIDYDEVNELKAFDFGVVDGVDGVEFDVAVRWDCGSAWFGGLSTLSYVNGNSFELAGMKLVSQWGL